MIGTLNLASERLTASRIGTQEVLSGEDVLPAKVLAVLRGLQDGPKTADELSLLVDSSRRQIHKFLSILRSHGYTVHLSSKLYALKDERICRTAGCGTRLSKYNHGCYCNPCLRGLVLD